MQLWVTPEECSGVECFIPCQKFLTPIAINFPNIQLLDGYVYAMTPILQKFSRLQNEVDAPLSVLFYGTQVELGVEGVRVLEEIE